MTTDTLSLFDDAAELVHPDYAPAATIEERFHAFHEANPWVFSVLVRMTAERVARGRRRVSMKYLFERLRDDIDEWRPGMGDAYAAINNDFTSEYARLVMQRHPEWDGVFQLRALRRAA